MSCTPLLYVFNIVTENFVFFYGHGTELSKIASFIQYLYFNKKWIIIINPSTLSAFHEGFYYLISDHHLYDYILILSSIYTFFIQFWIKSVNIFVHSSTLVYRLEPMWALRVKIIFLYPRFSYTLFCSLTSVHIVHSDL